MSISVIIPTYKEPAYLDLCIKSILDGQVYPNEIIVVVDGMLETNKEVLEKYKGKITPIIFEENYGQSKSTNFGVYNAKFDKVLIVNDDNVFPKNWDYSLLQSFNLQTDVVSPNQIEPYSSMFLQFIKHDFGRTAETFDLEKFYQWEPTFKKDLIDSTGSTLPFLMSKINFLKVGGWDETYPSGNVVDWDFFLKCNLCGLKLLRNHNCNFYHFVSIGTRSPEEVENTRKKEMEGFEYFKYKWGSYPKHNPISNLKSI
jgi:glycosyltransferase involved in cell wall biosynthesis